MHCNEILTSCMSHEFYFNIITKYKCHSRRGFGLDMRFIDHFNIKIVIAFSYSAIANFSTLQITPIHAKSFPAINVFTSSCLVTASNNGYSFYSVLKSSVNGGFLPTLSVL
jgi:hypothetical protein